MNVEFTAHIRIKMKERRISETKVTATVHLPDFIRPTYSGREEHYKKFGKNYLVVIVRHESTALVAITTHWVRKPPEKW